VNFFAVRDALVVALKAALPAGTHVLTADDLDDIDEAHQPTPAVHVIYGGFSVGEVSRGGRTAVIEQRWLVVSVIKHTGDKAKASRESGARVEPLVQGVLDELMGWRHASTSMFPLTLQSPPAPVPRYPFYYFPLAFSATVALEKPR
jgi:hypothetical protein